MDRRMLSVTELTETMWMLKHTSSPVSKTRAMMGTLKIVRIPGNLVNTLGAFDDFVVILGILLEMPVVPVLPVQSLVFVLHVAQEEFAACVASVAQRRKCLSEFVVGRPARVEKWAKATRQRRWTRQRWTNQM